MLRGVMETVLAYAGLAIIPFLSRATIVKLSRRLGLLGFKWSAKTRRIAMANLDIAFGNSLTAAEKEAIAKRSYQTLVLAVLDVFWFSRNTDERLRRYVDLDALYASVKDIKPAIAVTGHFGSWEILGQSIALIDPPFLAVAAHIKNPGVDRVLERLRSRGSQRISFREGAMRDVMRILRDGGRVGLLLDQNVLPKDGGVFVDFFGLPVVMSSAAERLSRKTGHRVGFGFCVPDDDGFYRTHVPPPISPADAGAADGQITQRIANVLEEAIRGNPGRWIWMYMRWKYMPPGASREKYPFYARPVELAGRSKRQGRTE